MNKRSIVACITTLLLNLLACGPALGALSVGNSLGCQYTKIQDAINAAGTTDSIHVEPSHMYSEHLLISDKSLTICASACGESVCTAKTHVSVDGATALKNTNPLLRIQSTGGNSLMVTLSRIDFSNAHSAIDGGGIAWAAPGSLTLNDVLVTGNHALNGAGIYFTNPSTSTLATLTFGDNVSISNNTTIGSGGGVYIGGLSQFYMVGSNDRIFQNTADSDVNDSGDGGGICAVSPANVSIRTAVPANATIYSNTAYNGGGIALLGSGVDSGASTGSETSIAGDLNYPVRIESNTATHFGGGVYLQPKVFASATINAVELKAYGYRIDANTAFEGSAIYADTDSASAVGAGGTVSLNQAICRPHVECNTIAGNLPGAYAIGGTPASVVVIKDNAQLNAHAVRMHDNNGEYLLRSSGSKAAVFVSLLYGNHVADTLITGDTGSQQLQFVQCTIAANTIEGAQVISGSLETLSNSLIDQAGKAAFSGTGTPVVFNVVATDAGGLPADPSIQQQQPLFVDAANDDFHLLVQRYDDGSETASPGVDYATAGISQIDIDGRLVDQDIPGIGAAGNVRDLGALEMQPISDRIFASGIGDPVILAQ